jgi:uncharacterized membrane protein YvbJ
MQCKRCGTDIADKAIVCYRCGAPTAEAVAPTPPAARRRRLIIPGVAAAAILIIAALYMAMAARGSTPPLLNWGMLVLAAVIVVWRFWTGRR